MLNKVLNYEQLVQNNATFPFCISYSILCQNLPYFFLWIRLLKFEIGSLLTPLFNGIEDEEKFCKKKIIKKNHLLKCLLSIQKSCLVQHS